MQKVFHRTPAATPAHAAREMNRVPAGATRQALPAGSYPGNQAALRYLSRIAPRVQCRLEVGAVDDPLEAEADRAADQVLRMADPARSVEDGAVPDSQLVLRRAACEQEDASRQAKIDERAEAGGEAPPIVHQVLDEPGQPLDRAAREFFEPRFGRDFSSVQVHADRRAADSAQSIGALAYTAGSHLVFSSGRYEPRANSGRNLLAHELAHVAQQGRAAAVSGGGVGIASGPVAPAIRRDTPTGQSAPTPQDASAGSPSQAEPLMVIKQFTPAANTVSRQEVTQALTDFLYKAQAAQGGQTLHVTDSVRWAVRMLFQGDPIVSASAEAFLAGTTLPGNAPEFAAAVTKLLPDSMPRSRMAHLATQSAKDTPGTGPKSFGDAAGGLVADSTVAPIIRKLPIPKDLQDKIIEGARSGVTAGLVGMVDQAISGSPLSDQAKSGIHSAVEAALKQKAGTPMDRQQEGAGSPYAQVQPPSAKPPMGSVPGEHILNLPAIPWDIPTPAVPKPNLPQPPMASDAQAVDKIIQALDDSSLIPAAAKGTANAGDYASAKELARNVANLLAAADKKKQFSVDLTIGMNYRHVDDLAVIFDKISEIVKQIAAALPGGAANVGQVIVSPARAGKDDSFPARRIVKLHGGG